MRRLIGLFLLLTVPVALSFNSNPVVAGDGDPGGGPAPGPGKQAISKERPFEQDIPAWDKGVELCRKVTEGDEEAIERFRSSGLTYLPHLAAVGFLHEEYYDAVMRHWDWFEDMQRWEHAFVNSDPRDVLRLYKDLQARFRVAGAQLARAVMYAHHWGDYETRDALIELDPESPWVQAAHGFLAWDLTPKQACEKMIPALRNMNNLYRLSIQIYLGLAVPKRERPDPRGRAMQPLQVSDITTPSGISQFLSIPHQWQFSLFYERLGALLAEVEDDDFVKATVTRMEETVDVHAIGKSVLTAFYIPLWFARGEFDKLNPDLVGERAIVSVGVNLSLSAIFSAVEYMWYSKATAAVVAFTGMPDNRLCRRNMLARCMDVGDPMITRLACRSLLAHYDDELEGYSDVARALLRFGNMPELTEAYGKALKSTGHAELKKLAARIENDDADALEKPAVQTLGLSVGQKAGLLQPFSNETETKTHGGEVALYWLNRAVFLHGQRCLRRSDAMYWKAMSAYEGEEISPTVNPIILSYLDLVGQSYTNEHFERALADAGETYPKLAKKVRRIHDEMSSEDAPLSKRAAAVGVETLSRWEEMSDELKDELLGHPEKWGGLGHTLAIDHGMLIDDYPFRRRHYEKAVEMSPLSDTLHARQGPDNENAGTMIAANWDHAARHILALHLLHPLSLKTVCASSCIHLRNGEGALPTIAQALSANQRASYLDPGLSYAQGYSYLGSGRKQHRELLHRSCMADPSRINERKNQVYTEFLYHFWWAYNSSQVVGSAACIKGPEAHFVRGVMASYTATHNMQDVNTLLNFAIKCCVFDPEVAISYVERADQLGVSGYGRFVGTQATSCAHALLGKLSEDNGLKRYHELRGDRHGIPKYLDVYLVSGLTHGNNHAEAEKAIEAIKQYDHSDNGNKFDFLWRRAHMLAGKHAEITELPLPENEQLLEGGHEYTLLFHEARALLDAGDFETLLSRTGPFLDFSARDDMGVYLDAMVLKAIALKAAGKDLPRDETTSRLRVIEPDFVDVFLPSPNMIDWHAMEMLCGRDEMKPLPEIATNRLWHAGIYGERPPAFYGAGRNTFDEMHARDRFMRGIWAWLMEDAETARAKLKECIDFNVRSSHEYHIAEWLLENPLKKGAETPEE